MNAEMQIEYHFTDGVVNRLSEMNLNDLTKLLTSVTQEIMNRIPKISNEYERNLANSTLLSVKSILFAYEVKLLGKSYKPESYTPHRANELNNRILPI